MEAQSDQCLHDEIQPIPGKEDWGRCAKCGADDFPITERAAYGDTACKTCHDTGVVDVDVTGQRVTRADGSESVIAYGFGSGPCPDCDAGGDDGKPEWSEKQAESFGKWLSLEAARQRLRREAQASCSCACHRLHPALHCLACAPAANGVIR